MILQDWWYTTLLGAPGHACPPLRGDVQADVLVIGAGAAGLAAAMRLMDSGQRVVVLERNICGGSSTGKSAGFLTPDSELELAQLLRRFGRQGARDLWDCAQRGVDLMAGTARAHGIACDLVEQDCLFLANDAGGWRDVQAEARARASLGYHQTLYDREELPAVLGSTTYLGGERYGGTYGINALRYAQGAKQVLLDHGVEVHESSEVVRIEGRTARTHLGSVTAQDIIVCADKPARTLTRYADNVYHAQTFLAISEPLSKADVAALFPQGPLQCWDSDLVYTYYRLTGDQRLLLGGGSMLTTFSRNDVTGPRVIDRVVARTRRRFRALRHVEFIQYWPGRIDTTRDLVPTVARDPRAPWLHLVLGCVGLPWATFCGDFAARHVLDDAGADDHRYYRYFSPDRRFLVPLGLEPVLGKQVVFSLNNAWAKYRQVDAGGRRAAREGEP